MEVTKENFEVAYDRIIELLPVTVTIGVDIECTGIKPDLSVYRSDTPPEYYYKIFPVPSRYRMIQLGLSFFVPSAGGYTAHTFFFYLLPDSQDEHMDCVFRVSVATIEFLNRAGNIDYNKWLKQGIPYYTKDQQKQLAEVVSQSDLGQQLAAMNISTNPTRIYNSADLCRLTDTLAAFDRWFESRSQEPFILSEKKPYLRRYFHENNKTFHSNVALLSVVERRDENGVVTAEFRRKSAASSGVEDRLKKALGFMQLWKKLKESAQLRKTPVVGHNFTIDMLFIASGFERTLPRKYSEGKELLASIFPRVFDTKAIAEAIELEGLSLSQLHAEVVGVRRDKKKLNFNCAYPGNLGFHNAGVDAQAAGEVLLTFSTLIPDWESFSNCLKIYSARFYHMKLGAKDEDLLTKRKAIVLYPKKGQGSKEDVLKEVNAHKQQTREESFVTEHRGLSCTAMSPRVYFVESLGNPEVSPQLQQKLSVNYVIKSLTEHYKQVYSLLEKIEFS